jgi:hypothetical protein
VLRIPDVYPGSSQIPDNSFPSGIQNFSIRIRNKEFTDPRYKIFPFRICIKEFKYFIPKLWCLSSWNYDPGCSSWIRISDFYPSRIPGPGGLKGTGSRIRIRDTALLSIVILGSGINIPDQRWIRSASPLTQGTSMCHCVIVCPASLNIKVIAYSVYWTERKRNYVSQWQTACSKRNGHRLPRSQTSA